MSGYSPHDAFEYVPGIRIRRVPEMKQVFIYTPLRPGVHRFNQAAWLVFELANGHDFASIVAESEGVLGSTRSEVERNVTVSLRAFERRGIVQRTARGPSPHTGGEVVGRQVQGR